MSPRVPVSVVYGGAHLFKADTPKKLGAIASRTLETFAVDLASFSALTALEHLSAEICEAVYQRVRAKLEREPVEDFRIDFEDGYGIRSAAEAEAHARAAAAALAEVDVPLIGVRIRSLEALRPLEVILESKPRRALAVTLPKVRTVHEVQRMREAIDRLSEAHAATLRMELMIETPEALREVAALCAAAGPRLESLHFGAYDFLSAMGVSAQAQALDHPWCDAARFQLLLHARVRVSDGATHLLPIGEDRIVANMRAHAMHIRRALSQGITQGWDLHPAQLIARYAQVYAFYLEGRDAAAARLKRFVLDAAKARVAHGVFDDAATALGLINFFLQAYECGAFDDADLAAAGVTPALLRERSFEALVEAAR